MLICALALSSQDAIADPEETATAEIPAGVAEAASNYATSISNYVQQTNANEADGRFQVLGPETLAMAIHDPILATMIYGDAPAGEYTMEIRATYFELTDAEASTRMLCEPGLPSTMVDQPVEDANGHELTFRGCWGGAIDEETGALTGGVIYQMNSGPHYVQYQAMITGPDEAGVRERLSVLEPAVGQLAARTVFVPAGE
ncbi:MAG: hypothetical protein CMF74_15595 [Maricaulis sp.]|jgi:hypothetical protein|nr:hypothetical protein [Maricaulis sp.]HAQ35340.1 hypothetical protein [Alphaproteobacteria bacterium]|tara:strand:+ start:671 stop:1273 length:603 start_codon:yes stop_codon:yes gene_type:complete